MSETLQKKLIVTGINRWILLSFFLPSATKLRRLCFHRHVSVHRGVSCPGTGLCLLQGGVFPVGGGLPGPRGVWSWEGACSQGVLVSQHALRETPPEEMATAADGMHPTGMHSVLLFIQCSVTCVLSWINASVHYMVPINEGCRLGFSCCVFVCMERLRRRTEFLLWE